MNGPAGLPPSPAAVADYFGRKLCTISEFSPDGILHNERLWVVETCGLPESELDPPPIITREQAARLDDPFSDKRNFGPRGQYAKCAGCGAVFESLGLRLCAACCKSSHASQPKRCQECGAPLHPGARKTLKFCSAACKQKAYCGGTVTDRDDANSAERLPGPPQADQALTDRAPAVIGNFSLPGRM